MRFLSGWTLVVILVMLLSGCADMGMNLSNPFDTTSDVNDVFYDQFPDIAIPSDMIIDRTRSLVSTSQNGTKIGLLTAQGRVERSSLSNALMQHMLKQGWTLRGAVTGGKTMHIYEKDQRYAVIYLYDQITKTAMEIWVATHLANGVMSTGDGFMNMGTGNDIGQPSFYLTPLPNENTTQGQTGGVQQEGLTQ